MLNNADRERMLFSVGIVSVALLRTNTEGYRSGHNEAVLKTVREQSHKGSNPFPSAIS